MAEPPNQTLQYFLNLLWRKTIDPSSDLYLPKLILGQRDPAYEPYTIDDSWHVAGGTISDAATQICTAYNPDPDGLGQPDGLPDMWIVDAAHAPFKESQPFVINGISNLKLSQPKVVEGTTAEATATLGEATGWRYGPLTVVGNWTLSQRCTDITSGQGYQGDGYGYVSMVIKSGTIDGRITVNAVGSDQLEVVVDALDFKTSATPDNVVVTVQLMEITDPNLREMWNRTANLAFTDTGTLKLIMAQVADIIGNESARKEFGKVATDALRQIINDAHGLEGKDAEEYARLTAEWPEELE